MKSLIFIIATLMSCFCNIQTITSNNDTLNYDTLKGIAIVTTSLAPTVSANDVIAITSAVVAASSGASGSNLAIPLVVGIMSLIGIIVRFFEKRHIKRKQREDDLFNH